MVIELGIMKDIRFAKCAATAVLSLVVLNLLAALPAAGQEVPVVEKPFSPTAFEEAVWRLMTAAAS